MENVTQKNSIKSEAMQSSNCIISNGIGNRTHFSNRC